MHSFGGLAVDPTFSMQPLATRLRPLQPTPEVSVDFLYLSGCLVDHSRAYLQPLATRLRQPLLTLEVNFPNLRICGTPPAILSLALIHSFVVCLATAV